MYFTKTILTFIFLSIHILAMPVTEPVVNLSTNNTNGADTTYPGILTSRQVHTVPWPGCIPHDGFCQLGSWQGQQPEMALRLWDFYCIEIGRNDWVPNLGYGGQFAFASQLRYMTIVEKYYQINDLPPYVWYGGVKTGDVFQEDTDRTCYDWQGGKFCFLRFRC